MLRPFVVKLAWLLPCQLVTHQAHAQEAETGTDSLEVVVRGTRDADTSGDIQATAVLSADDVRRSGPGSTTDSLRETPGVSVQQTTPGQGTVYVRGLSGRAVGHSVDGVRLNTAFYRAGNNPYFGLIDPYGLSKIVVVPGATSVEYGSDALGGAVLMSTPLPGYSATGTSTSGHIYQSIGSNPLSHVSHGDVSLVSRSLSAIWGMTVISAGDVVPGQGQRTPEPASYRFLTRDVGDEYSPELSRKQRGTGFDLYASNLTLQKKFGRTELVARLQGSIRPELVRYDSITPRFKHEFPRSDSAVLAPLTRQMAQLEVNHRPHGWLRSAQFMLAWQRISERSSDRGLDEVCLSDVAGAVIEPENCNTTLQLVPSETQSLEWNSSDAVTLRVSGEGRLSEHFTARAGVEAHWDFISSRAEERAVDSATAQPVDARYPTGSNAFEAGAYAKGIYSSRLVSAYAGARAMGFSLDINERDDGTVGFQRALVDLALTSGVRWQFSKVTALVTNVGRGVRMPNVADFSGLGPRAKGRFQVPNSQIGPEHSYSADLGVKLLHGGLRLDTLVFFTRYADAVVLAPTTVSGEQFTAEGDRFYHSENAARVDYYGLDMSGKVPLAMQLSLFGRGLAMIGEERSLSESGILSVTPADRVPPYQGELGLDWKNSSEWQARIWARFRARQQRLNDPVNLDDNRIPEGGTPGYVTFHARASRSLGKDLEAAVLLNNFTNQLVLEHGSGFYSEGVSALASLAVRVR